MVNPKIWSPTPGVTGPAKLVISFELVAGRSFFFPGRNHAGAAVRVPWNRARGIGEHFGWVFIGPYPTASAPQRSATEQQQSNASPSEASVHFGEGPRINVLNVRMCGLFCD